MAEKASQKSKFILFSLSITILFFFFLEIIARFLGFSERIRLHPLDSEFGWRMERESHRFTPAGDKAQYLLIGDSITYYHSEKPDSFTQRLFQEYHQPVINLSGVGYSTGQELLILEAYKNHLPQIKTVVLNFCVFNDFIDNHSPLAFHGYIKRPLFTFEGEQLNRQKTKISYSNGSYFLHWFRDQTGTYYLIAKVLRSLNLIPQSIIEQSLGKKMFDTPPPTKEEWEPYFEASKKGMPVTRAILEQMNHFVTQDMKIDFLVLIHPTAYHTKEWDSYQLKPEVKDFFTHTPYKTYDLGCFYKANNIAVEEALLDRPGHLLYSGHFALAKWLDQYFRGNIHFPECFISRP